MSRSAWVRRQFSRRSFLGASVKAGAAAIVMRALPAAGTSAPSLFTPRERLVLDAALARMIPAEGEGDWSAADLGAGRYIERLLAGTGKLYAGGPFRRHFARFQKLPLGKRRGWARELSRQRDLYRAGLGELDRRAGGDFVSAAPVAQDQILDALDLEGSPFFGALYDHTMEGVYAHPVYGGNAGFRAWRDLGYQGDVHGVRHPGIGPPGAAWNRYGGYAPEEMARPGEEPGP